MVAVLVCLLLAGAGVCLWSCGAEPAAEPDATTSTGAPDTAAATAVPALPSFEEAWTASLAALETLGPTRVKIVETTQGRVAGEGIPPEQSVFGPQTEEAEQLFDIAGGRARLTRQTADRMTKITVVQGRERTTVTSQPMMDSDWVSVSTYISLEKPKGLPLPLWAGSAVGPTEGYADLLTGLRSGVEGAASEGTILEGTVEQREDGGMRLSWQRAYRGVASAMSLSLDSAYLPVRIELAGAGTPTEGDLQGMSVEYTTTIVYEYERVASFSDSDFVLDIPAGAFREAVTHELALEHPWSGQADWGQYWLGNRLEEWPLTRAEYAIHGGGQDHGGGAEPGDEAVFLLYDRPEAVSPNENIQVMVRPLRGRYYDDSLAYAEQRVAAGDWARRDMTLAGRSATVYSGTLEGGADDRIDSIHVYLPDAWVHVQVWAPVDPLLVLGALRPVE